MFDALMNAIAAERGWVGLVMALLESECRCIATQLSNLRKRILVAVCIWALGFAFLTTSLVSVSALIFYLSWPDYSVLLLCGFGLVYGIIGAIMIRYALHQLS